MAEVFFLSLSSSTAAVLSSAALCAIAHFVGLFRASAALLHSSRLDVSACFLALVWIVTFFLISPLGVPSPSENSYESSL
jgi:hypothetical protein